MSIVIGFQFGDYALLCADTRTSYRQGARQWVDDTRPKVHRWGHGLIAGSGFSNLLDPVIARVQADTPSTTLAMETIVEEERDRVRKVLATSCEAADLESWIYTTGFFITYGTHIDGAPTVRLSIIHPSVGATSTQEHAVRFLLDNSVLVIVPPDAVAAAPKDGSFAERAEKGLRPLSSFEDVAAHFRHHVSLCRELVWDASRCSDSVSPQMIVGVHARDGDCDLLDVMDCRPERWPSSGGG